jgi:hypothetical protein
MVFFRAGLRRLHIHSTGEHFANKHSVHTQEVLACLTRLSNLEELVLHQWRQGDYQVRWRLRWSKKVGSMSVTLWMLISWYMAVSRSTMCVDVSCTAGQQVTFTPSKGPHGSNI